MSIEFVFGLLWVFQCAWLLGAAIYMMFKYYKHERFSHITLMMFSMFILCSVDMYTIIFEQYPVFAFKSMFMLLAFIIANVGLYKIISKL